jgi:hypothetical protein
MSWSKISKNQDREGKTHEIEKDFGKLDSTANFDMSEN